MSQIPRLPDFNLNNPKNYFGYTLAVAIADSDEQVDKILEHEDEDGNKITSDIKGARNGARHLELVVSNSDTLEITELGHRVVSVSVDEHGNEREALDSLRKLFGGRTPFVEARPAWESVTQEVCLNQSGISRLVRLMQTIHSRRGGGPFPLPVLVQETTHLDRDFAKQCFFTSSGAERFDKVDWEPPGSNSTPEILCERSLYKSSVVHQLKSMLCHAGILTTKGRDRANLEFSVESEQFLWALTPPFRNSSIPSVWERQSLAKESLDVQEQVRDTQSPDRVDTAISRIIRNTALVKELKAEYGYCCQVCGERRQRAADDFYAEGHHLHPLGEDGPDTRGNIVIVCPTCHVDLDYGMVTIDPDTLVVSHRYDDNRDGERLTISTSDTVDPEYLSYHNEEIAELSPGNDVGSKKGCMFEE